MRIDVHTHAFHPKIAQKVLDQLSDHYGITPVGDGTVDDLLARAAHADLEKVMLHTAATDPSQVVPANNWAIELTRKHPEVVAFGSLHPDYQDNEREIERLTKAGITGLKFHPDFQGFFLDSPAFYQLMEMVPKRFTLMIHVGDDLPHEAGGPAASLPRTQGHRRSHGRLSALEVGPGTPRGSGRLHGHLQHHGLHPG